LSVEQWDSISVDGWSELPVSSPGGVYGFGGQSVHITMALSLTDEFF
jgi:hypothetical protein